MGGGRTARRWRGDVGKSAGEVPRVFERDSAGAAWEATPVPYPATASAGSLAIFREGGALRVLGAGAIPQTNHTDELTPPPAGSPPALVNPYPTGAAPAYIFRQTSSGWIEQEHEHDELGEPVGNYKQYDRGYEPDPTWAVLVGETGSPGWAVGGFPREEAAASGLQTADISRYSYPSIESASVPGVGAASVPVESGAAAFAIGGGAQCAAPCSARAEARIGPDTWISSALARAGAIPSVRAFIYTGPRVTAGLTTIKASREIPYSLEFARYAELLAGSSKPVYGVASATDRVEGSQCPFEAAFPQYFEQKECASGQSAYYAEHTTGAAGQPVLVVMLDNSTQVGANQLAWLRGELAGARLRHEAAIVVGSANLNAQEEHGEDNAGEVVQALVSGHASAYFFDAPELNVKLQLHGSTIPAFGSGTLGYVSVQNAEQQNFIGASGFLLAQVGAYSSAAGVEHAPVSAELIPDIGEGPNGEEELALEAQDGTLLRRSHAAKFAALARRPRAGNTASGESEAGFSYLYTPIPANCVGAVCPEGGGVGITPEYAFTSSNEEVARFVKPDLSSNEPDAVALNSKEEPVFEETRRAGAALVESKSGLLCALNAGTTTITISAGGVSAALPVTVQAGSVRRPCGTTPLHNLPTQEAQVAAPANPPTQGGGAAPAANPSPVPVPPSPPVIPAAAAPTVVPPVHALVAPFIIQPPSPVALPAIVPPPLVAEANPTPPSGTSAVTEPVEAAEKEEEQEEATESVSNQAVAYRAAEHEPLPLYLLGLALLAAFAGASVRRRPRRGGREQRIAPATISTIRFQRRNRGDRRRW